MIEFAPELARLQGIAQECDCCVPPCCNIGRISCLYDVKGLLSVDNVTWTAEIRFNWSASFVMQREDVTGLPIDQEPSNRTFSVTDIGDECQITNNKPKLPDGTQDLWLVGRGKYRYEERDDLNEIIAEQDTDIEVYLVAIDAALDCEGKAPGLGGENPTVSTFTFLIEGMGTERPNCPEFAPYGDQIPIPSITIDDLGRIRPHYGSEGRIENQCAGWDTASLTETLVFNAFRGVPGADPNVGEWMEEDAFHHDDAGWFDNRNWQDETDDPKGDQQR